MKKQTRHIEFTVYNGINELKTQERELLKAAIDAIGKAYAPYSQFRVGAAVLLGNGKIVTGNNQENAAYPSGMCAERVAIWNAMSQYPDETILKVALTARSSVKTLNEPVAPCGACRQTMLEYEYRQNQPIEVIFTGEKGPVVKASSISDLLPIAFDDSFLKK